MTSKDRLVYNSRSPLARELLRSAELDEPPAHSMVRLALALGLGSSAVVSTIATGAAATTEATLGAVVATAAKGAAVAATGTGTVATANVAASTAVLSSAVSAANVAASTVMLSSAGGVAVAPAVTGTLSAVGMLKAMAIVSLTCGALSFGGTKLGMIIAEAPTAAASVSAHPVQAMPIQVKLAAAQGNVAPSVIAPHESDNNDGDDDVLPSLMQEAQHSNALNETVRQAALERNVGRQDIKTANGPTSMNGGSDRSQGSEVSQQDMAVPTVGGLRHSAVAAFPSDDEQPAPSASIQAEKKAKARAQTPKVDSDSDLDRSLLERARTAVAAGQPLVALQALDAYRTHARSGTLRAESVLLRVRALLALGQRSAAEREAMPLIKAAPQSRTAARLRELIGVPNDTP